MPTNVQTFSDKKRRGEKIVMITAYDAVTAAMVHAAGVDAILVGDSAAMVFAGHETTLPITMNEMVYHTQAVARGARGAFIIADMPFLSFQCGRDAAMANAGRFLKEAGAQAVKLEGAADIDLVSRMVRAGIPVMGHVGLLPQSINELGGFKAQGKTPASAALIIEQAAALDAAGCFAIVLETIPSDLAQKITTRVRAATIGIGAGSHCDGQVQVVNDTLGMATKHIPRHAKRYAEFYDTGLAAIREYVAQVREHEFPGSENEVNSVQAPASEAVSDGPSG